MATVLTQQLKVLSSHVLTLATTQACVLPGNPAGDLSLCRTTPSQLSHTSQGSPECTVNILNPTELYTSKWLRGAGVEVEEDTGGINGDENIQ